MQPTLRDQFQRARIVHHTTRQRVVSIPEEKTDIGGHVSDLRNVLSQVYSIKSFRRCAAVKPSVAQTMGASPRSGCLER
jgi:hypothetical protein